jgi:ABC-type uncharacterized transport system substrate-binding protein
VRRRGFILLLGGAAACPMGVLGQVSDRPIIAWLSLGTEAGSEVFIRPFLQGMRELGYVENRNFNIAYRFADGYIDRLPALAKELVHLKPTIILAPASGPAVAAKNATSTIPIVVPALADAVHLGLVASDARPGGNVTGITPYVAGLPAKQMELAREIVPGASKVGILANLDDPKAPPQFKELQAAGSALELKVIAAEANTPEALDGAFQKLGSERVEVVIVLQTSMLVNERSKIAMLAAAERFPAIYGYREHVEAGGLISYGVNLRGCFRHAALFVHKILNGAAPGDLPIEFPTEVELVINMKVAKALGLGMPPSLLARADEVIE